VLHGSQRIAEPSGFVWRNRCFGPPAPTVVSSRCGSSGSGALMASWRYGIEPVDVAGGGAAESERVVWTTTTMPFTTAAASNAATRTMAQRGASAEALADEGSELVI